MSTQLTESEIILLKEKALKYERSYEQIESAGSTGVKDT